MVSLEISSNTKLSLHYHLLENQMFSLPKMMTTMVYLILNCCRIAYNGTLYQLPFSGMVLNLSRNPFLACLFCTNLLSNVMVMAFGLILEPVHLSPFISPHRLNQSDFKKIKNQFLKILKHDSKSNIQKILFWVSFIPNMIYKFFKEVNLGFFFEKITITKIFLNHSLSIYTTKF